MATQTAVLRKSVVLKNVETGSATKHGTSYLDAAFGDPALLVYNAMTTLKDVEFDTFVGRGLSGALVAPLLARAMGKWFAIARKPCTEGDHSGQTIEGSMGDRWVFVDDLICSGNTFRKAYNDVLAAKDCECVGIYLYGTSPTAKPAFCDQEHALMLAGAI